MSIVICASPSEPKEALASLGKCLVHHYGTNGIHNPCPKHTSCFSGTFCKSCTDIAIYFIFIWITLIIYDVYIAV